VRDLGYKRYVQLDRVPQFFSYSTCPLPPPEFDHRLLHIMAINMAENKALDYALRALQLIFAIIVMGTDGYGVQN
jgi:hypothetical protein